MCVPQSTEIHSHLMKLFRDYLKIESSVDSIYMQIEFILTVVSHCQSLVLDGSDASCDITLN